MRSRALLGVLGLVFAALAGCARQTKPARPDVEDPLLPSDGRPSSSSAGAGPTRAECTHDAKDLAPCWEDCERRIVFGCTVLASRTERGEGTPRDTPRAVLLHERACELRDAASCVSAARMHASGRGVPPSRARQIELLAMACKLGDVLSCALSAKAYATGNGVPRDEHRATDLLQTACAAGLAQACDALEPPPP